MLDRFDRHVLAMVGVALAGLIFTIDALSPIGILVPTLYLLLIPILAAFEIAGATLWYLLAVTALSIVGAALSPVPTPTPGWAIAEVVINRIMMAVAAGCTCYAVMREVALRRALGQRDDTDLVTGFPTRAPFLARAETLRRRSGGPLALVALRLANRPALQAVAPAMADAGLVAIANGCRTALGALALGAHAPVAVLAVMEDDPAAPASARVAGLCRALEAQPLIGPDGAALPVAVSWSATPLDSGEPLDMLVGRVIAGARESAVPVPGPAVADAPAG